MFYVLVKRSYYFFLLTEWNFEKQMANNKVRKQANILVKCSTLVNYLKIKSKRPWQNISCSFKALASQLHSSAVSLLKFSAMRNYPIRAWWVQATSEISQHGGAVELSWQQLE